MEAERVKEALADFFAYAYVVPFTLYEQKSCQQSQMYNGRLKISLTAERKEIPTLLCKYCLTFRGFVEEL